MTAEKVKDLRVGVAPYVAPFGPLGAKRWSGAGEYRGALDAFAEAANIAREQGFPEDLALAAVGYGEMQTVLTDPT